MRCGKLRIAKLEKVASAFTRQDAVEYVVHASVEQPPDWLVELVESGLCTKANKFSKFATGAYALMSAEERVIAEQPAQYGLP